MAKNYPRGARLGPRNNAVGPLARPGAQAGKSRWVSIAAGCTALTSIWTATEVFAFRFKFQPALDALHIGPVYEPFAILPWAYTYGSQFPGPTKLAGMAGAAIFLAGGAAIGARRKRMAQMPDYNSVVDGSAQWITRDGIEHASLLYNDGVFVGGWIDPKTNKLMFLRHNGPEHSLTIGPSRSGKGIGLVLPTLWGWPASVVVADLKGELTAATSGHRALALENNILVFEPAAATGSVSWNPLEEIRMGTEYETADVQNLAELIVDPDGKGITEYFDKAARVMLIGVILHALYRRREGVRATLYDSNEVPVAKPAPENLRFGMLVDESVARDGKPMPDSVVYIDVKKGEPMPVLEKDGMGRPAKAMQYVHLYDVKEVVDRTADPRFQVTYTVPDKPTEIVPVGYQYEIVTYPAPAVAPSIYEIGRLLSDPNRPVDELWKEMLTFNHFAERDDIAGVGPKKRTHATIAMVARSLISMPSKQLGGVLESARTLLDLWHDPLVARNTATSDFKIEDLMYSQKPVTLYIVTQPTDKNRLRPLVRILLNMIVRILAPKQQFEEGRPISRRNHRLLFMLDEFPSLGKLSIIEESLAFTASYGLKFNFICQDKGQLTSKDSYGPDELITSGCHIQNFYAPNRVETAEHISRLTGVTTVNDVSVSVSGTKGLFAGRKTYTETPVHTQRPLMTEDEVMRMPAPKKNAKGEIIEAGDMLVYVTGQPMVYGRQILYWEEPYFDEASKVKPAPLLRFRRVPWIDKDGVVRHSLMEASDADALEMQLRDNFELTPPPIGEEARWIRPQEDGLWEAPSALDRTAVEQPKIHFPAAPGEGEVPGAVSVDESSVGRLNGRQPVGGQDDDKLGQASGERRTEPPHTTAPVGSSLASLPRRSLRNLEAQVPSRSHVTPASEHEVEK